MERVDAESIGDVLRRTIREEGLSGRLDEVRAVQIWPAVVGDMLASMMGKPIVSKGVMTVHVRMAPLRQEMNMRRSSLLRLLNEALGRNVISDIRFR